MMERVELKFITMVVEGHIGAPILMYREKIDPEGENGGYWSEWYEVKNEMHLHGTEIIDK